MKWVFRFGQDYDGLTLVITLEETQNYLILDLLGIFKIHHHYFMILKKMQSHLIFQITLHYVYPMFLMHPIYKLPLQVRV